MSAIGQCQPAGFLQDQHRGWRRFDTGFFSAPDGFSGWRGATIDDNLRAQCVSPHRQRWVGDHSGQPLRDGTGRVYGAPNAGGRGAGSGLE